MHSVKKPPLEIVKVDYQKDTTEAFLILGGGVAGLSAAIAIRERNPSAKITIVGKEPFLPYTRPMLTKAPMLYFKTRAYLIHDAEWFSKNRIEVLTNREVTSLNCGGGSVGFDDGGKIFYNKCVYALGADSYIPPIPGADRSTVITVRELSDIERVRRALLGAQQAVIIGGGVIGLEMAWELKKAGLGVKVVELADTLMKRVLDSGSAKFLESCIKSVGVDIITGARTSAIESDGRKKIVRLEDGSCLSADFVIMSAGATPNVEPARIAGIKTNRAILVNRHMETSVPNIYACGDCAEFEGYHVEAWTRSQSQGYVAGANAAGEKLCYLEQPLSLTLHTTETCLFTIGDMGNDPDKTYDRQTNHGNPTQNSESKHFLINKRPYGAKSYESYCYTNGTLVGATLIGDLTKMRSCYSWVRTI
jgi:NAD(P)H-nitrite reductase large subunit